MDTNREYQLKTYVLKNYGYWEIDTGIDGWENEDYLFTREEIDRSHISSLKKLLQKLDKIQRKYGL